MMKDPREEATICHDGPLGHGGTETVSHRPQRTWKLILIFTV